MPKLSPLQLTKAAEIFLASNPGTAEQIRSLTQAEADFMQTSLDQLRIDRTLDKIDKYAKAMGRNAMEMRFSLAADSFEEFDAWWKEYQANVNRILGL